jgi:hypothetical protein
VIATYASFTSYCYGSGINWTAPGASLGCASLNSNHRVCWACLVSYHRAAHAGCDGVAQECTDILRVHK